MVHRYAAIGKREAIGPAFQLLLGVVDDILQLTRRCLAG
jgi:hypothetical protein